HRRWRRRAPRAGGGAVRRHRRRGDSHVTRRQCPEAPETLGALLLLATLVQAPPPDRAAARRYWLAALDAEAELHGDSALALLERARAADPGFFPAQQEYISRHDWRGEYAEVRDAYAVPDPRGGIVTECLAFWTA